MPAQKRKLSVGSASLNIPESSVAKKQQQSSSLLFKPNISPKRSNLNQDLSLIIRKQEYTHKIYTSENRLQMQQTQTSNLPETESTELLLKVPKLSIKRKLNADSQISEFTIEKHSNSYETHLEADENTASSDSSAFGRLKINEENDEEINSDLLDESNEDDNSENSDNDSDTSCKNVYNKNSAIIQTKNNNNQPSIKIKIKASLENTDKNSEINKQPLNAKLIGEQNVLRQFKKVKFKTYDSEATTTSALNENNNNNLEIENDDNLDNKDNNNESLCEPLVKRGRGRPAKKPIQHLNQTNEEKTASTKAPRAITSYYLFCSEFRPKISEKNPELKLRAQRRIVAEMWSKLNDKEKLIWRQKAIKLRKKGSKGMISTGIINQTVKHQQQDGKLILKKKVKQKMSDKEDLNIKSNDELASLHSKKSMTHINKKPEIIRTLNPVPNHVEDCKPIDIASHFCLLGESLTNVGTRLVEHEGKFAIQGASAVLLDSFLCALGPLFCLTSQIEEMNSCPKQSLINILENISLIMPNTS